MKTLRSVMVVFILISFSSCHKMDNKNTASVNHSFDQDLEIHLSAIQNSNLVDLGPTVADDVSMIGPDGSKIDSKKLFMDFHKDWFKLKNWKWEGVVLKKEQHDSIAHALIRYRFTQNDSLGQKIYASDAYLLLIFRNSSGRWQLIHDQNTRIETIAQKN